MKILKLLSTLVLFVLGGNQCFTQDLSNKGKEFYLCFPQHVPSGSNLATLSIFITSDKASSGNITMGNAAFSSTFSIAANGIQEIQIPWAANRHISNAESNTVINKSIRIQVNPGQPAVVAYAQQWAGFRSAATLLLPVNVLGKKYYSISFTQNGQNNVSYLARSQFQIIAVKNNTVVTVTPRKNGVVGVPFTIFFPLAGDMYQYQSTDPGATGAAAQDLTGTLIESVASGSGGCLPIAVFSGSSNITFGTTSPACTGTSSDPLWQQNYPITTWGKNFGFVPFADYPNGTSYRVLASEDNTQVFFNGALVATLMAGQIYPALFNSTPVVTTSPINISADKPVCVAQYSTTEVCSGSSPAKGDPDMVILNPIEQNISDIIIFSSDKEGITRQWVNVLMKTVAIPSFRLNGAVPATPWVPFATLPGYSYLRHLLPGSGAYRLQADSGFNAIAYGWGTVESYAYSAGTNVKDLFTKIETVTPFGSATSPSVCRNNPTQFKITVPYPLDSMYWNFNGTHPNIMVNGPPVPLTPFSTAVVNGVTVYTYILVSPYTYPTAGTFPVTVTTYSQNTSGCGAEQDIFFDVEVYEKPVADFTFTSNGCTSPSAVSFLDNSNLNGRTATGWHWNFGDGNTSVLLNPSNTFATPGTFTVKHTVLNDIGCLSDTISKVVTITNQPVASFSAPAPYCNGTAVSFTNNSTLLGSGSITQYLWNFGDPPSGSSNTSILAAPQHLFTAPGPYTVSLTVTSSSGCQSVPFTFQITIAPTVTPTFTQVAPICSGASLSPLPTLSNNGITGTWAPALNNTATTTYTFTPDAGQCASATVTMTITVIPNVPPSFNPVPAICSGGVLNPLPTTSLNNFTGTWAPALNNTATTTYTFTPTAGQCATTATLTITVNPLISPTISCGTSTTSSVTFNWLAVTGATGYTVTYQVNANPLTNVGPVGNVLSYQVTGLSGGDNVIITVTPTGGAGTCFAFSSFTCVAVACIQPTVSISYAGPFCVSITTPQLPTLTGTGAFTGGTYSSTSGLTINSSTGAITPSTSTPGTYTVTYSVTPSGCTTVTATTPVTITSVITPAFTQVAPICSGVFLAPLPTLSNNGISGSWAPSVNNMITTTYTFTPDAGQCASTTTLTITINPNITPTFNQVAPICAGASLSPLPITSLNSFTGTWAPALNNNSTTTYIFTPTAGQCATTATMTITVNPILTPTINCGTSTTSSVIFNWSAVTGATGYTVSYQVNTNPVVNVGPIGNLLTYQVTSLTGGDNVIITVTPTGGAGTCFSFSSLTCSATACTPPTASISYAGPFCGNNSTPQNVTIIGTGNYTGGTFSSTTGLTINSTTGAITPSTSTPGTYTVTYTVPPGSGCPGIAVTTSVTINPVITPVFTPVAAICSGAFLSPLPTISNNGITGTWAPPLNNTVTTTYTFTPTAGLCASTGTLTITVNPNIIPTFAAVAPICSGAPLTALPTSSNNTIPITGSWSPALNNTATTTYTFTPTLGLCATTTTLTITVIPNDIPIFPAVAPICSGATLSPLPTTSNNNITGTWSPALNNTATTTYTFTPNTGQCGTTTTLTITVNPNITPTFNPVAAICSGGTLAPLPTTSNNGYTGTWAPTINNTVTTTYTFTPSAGQCATTTTLSITVNPNVTPTFNAVSAICSGGVLAPLPTTSLNSITGTWAPALNNTATTTYTFTPTAGQCAVTTTLTITVNPIVTPTFNPVPEICSGAVLAPLPTTSTNGITGTWAPALNNTATTTYTFTPTAGLCAVTATLTITVNPLPIADFTFSNPTCATKSILFTDQSVANAGTLTNWVWNFGDPASGLNNFSIIPNPTHVFSTAGTYNVTLIVTTSKSCISTIITKPVVINVLPKAAFTFPQVCLTDQVPFTDNSTITSGSIVGWNWNFGDPASGANNVSTSPSPTHLFSAVGSFNTTLIVTSSNGCKDTLSKPISINGSLLVSNFTVQNSSPLCSNRDVSITNASTVNFGSIIRVEVFWDYINDPTIQTIDPSPVPGKIYTHTYPEFGTPLTKTVSIRFVVYSGINCVSTFDRVVTLLATPTLQFDPITAVCSNVPSFQITEAQILNPLPGIGVFTGPGVSPGGLFNPIVAGSGLHTIQFTYTGTNGCINSLTQTIGVNPTPVANAGPDKFIIEGGVVILTPALNTGLLVSYSWSPTTGLSDPNIATPAASPPADITYVLTVTTDKGCTLNDEVFVKVLKALVIPNVFSPNADGINDKWIIQYLDGFPEGTINVYNRYGQSIFRSLGYANPWDGTFKGKPVPAGTYYYVVDPKRGSKILAGFVDVLR